MKKKSILLFCGILLTMTGCGKASSSAATETMNTSTTESVYADEVTFIDPTSDPNVQKGSRDNSAVCLIPVAPGTEVYSSDNSYIDVSNASSGYICASYHGDCQKVKLQITGPDRVTYTYNLSGGEEFFPLSANSGTYTIAVYENIVDNQYSTDLSQTLELNITDEFGAFLYPNQYCWFTSDYAAVQKGIDLAYYANDELEVITNIYNYVIKTVSYDQEKAATVASGYLCNVDETLSTKTGICLDYASLMTCMLRSQGIPTRLEVGYAGTAYHAWISTYIPEQGWVNGIIEFDGQSWSLMDPTFSANSSTETLTSFIGDGSNYTLKYAY